MPDVDVLVFPPLIWGVAAFSSDRPAEITLAIHELGDLTLVTTDQYFIFQFAAIAVISLTAKHDVRSPLPCWYGYYTISTAFMFELGAFGFILRTDPFAWNGLFVFWIPLTIFCAWILVTSYLVLAALKRQERDRDRQHRATAQHFKEDHAGSDPAVRACAQRQLRGGDANFRRSYVTLLIDKVELSSSAVRICGTRAALEHALIKDEDTPRGAMPIFDREWCRLQDSNL